MRNYLNQRLIRVAHYHSDSRRKTLAHFSSRLRLRNEQERTMAVKQDHNYFLILDFEATCERNGRIFPQEVIEFPVLKVNANSYDVESEFHQYVKPVHHPELTSFCTELTGITQEMVSDRKTFPEVLQSFDEWMNKEISSHDKYLFVTCGDWDLKTMLPDQCKTSGIEVPKYFKRWHNIKKAYSVVMQSYAKGMMVMLKGLGLQHTGRHHSGIDDCRNISQILKALAQKGYKFQETMSVP